MNIQLFSEILAKWSVCYFLHDCRLIIQSSASMGKIITARYKFITSYLIVAMDILLKGFLYGAKQMSRHTM